LAFSSGPLHALAKNGKEKARSIKPGYLAGTCKLGAESYAAFFSLTDALSFDANIEVCLNDARPTFLMASANALVRIAVNFESVIGLALLVTPHTFT
jgi:hypothetical protein